jgi:uncharacterized protein (DUF1330 family)
MAVLTVQHHVKDFDVWKPLFDGHGDVRRAHGGRGHTVYRGGADNGEVIIVMDFDTKQGAESFLTDPSLKAVMDQAGVDSEPKATLADRVEEVSY